MTYRVFFYVQHLLGIGHLMRSYRIAKSLADHGMSVTIASGGVQAPDIDHGLAKFIQLPPVKAGPAGFSDLIHPDGTMFGPADMQTRRDELLRQFEINAPHALITEAFPFGRRQMRFELLPLLDLAKQQRSFIAASVRDILQAQKNPARNLETAEIIERYYNAVLVHGAPDFAALEDSFAPIDRIRHHIVYTGLVGPPLSSIPSPHNYDVIVSAGGGAVGETLLRTALKARHLAADRKSRWLIVTGPNMPAAKAQEIEKLLEPGVDLVRFVADFPALLRGAHLSISQAGYNTVADLLAARCRSLLVPFDEGGETEQTRRSEILAERGLAIVVPSHMLSPESLLEGIKQARALPNKDPMIDLNGADNTSTILAKLLRVHFSGAQST
jgi:predicted glycosyltransferase